MVGIVVHEWAIPYLAMAIAVAVVVDVLAERLLSADPPAVAWRLGMAALTGALWPVVAVGAAQLALLHMIGRRRRGRAAVAMNRMTTTAR